MSFQDFLIGSKQINHSNINDSKIKIEEMLLKKNFMVPKPFNVTKEGTKLQLIWVYSKKRTYNLYF